MSGWKIKQLPKVTSRGDEGCIAVGREKDTAGGNAYSWRMALSYRKLSVKRSWYKTGKITKRNLKYKQTNK